MENLNENIIACISPPGVGAGVCGWLDRGQHRGAKAPGPGDDRPV